MKKIKYYPSIWQTMPYSFEMVDPIESRDTKLVDVMLKNQFASDHNVSEMFLNVESLSAIDSNGLEHFAPNFKNEMHLNLKGAHTGTFLKSKDTVEFMPNTYTSLRFYLADSGNTIVYSDRNTETINKLKFLEFELDKPLILTKNEPCKVVLHFDFVPYALPNFVKPFKSLFMKSKLMTSKLSNGLSS